MLPLHKAPNCLERLLPAITSKVPRVALGAYPTPVERLSALQRATGHHSLWIKRDDLCSDLYGGNKVRKSEYLFGQLLEQISHSRAGASPEGSDQPFLTYGPTGSHWVLTSLLYCKKLQVPVQAFLFRRPLTEDGRGNLELSRCLCSDIELHESTARMGWRMLRHMARHRTSRIFPPGGTSPRTTLGYVDAGLELADQVQRGELPEPSELYVPMGTGGTAAGLAIGMALGGLRSRIRAVRAADFKVANRLTLEGWIRATLRFLEKRTGQGRLLFKTGLRAGVVGGYLSPGYAEPSRQGQEALRHFAEEEDIALEATYTAKAAAAFLDRARAGRTGSLLLWHTWGGILDPAVVAGSMVQ